MLKKLRSSVVLKRHGSCVELLPDDVVELILERLPVESLLRFKCVSKKWKSKIQSRCFQERQLIRRKQSRGPDVLLVALNFSCDYNTDVQSIVLGSSIIRTVRFPTSGSLICHGSCDGLLCLYCFYTPSVVVNPATNWHQTFPLSSIQNLVVDNINKKEFGFPTPKLGFGKDKVKGTYKPVYLYNSSEFSLDNVTTCEVFDFNTKAWRYVYPASPYRINDYQYPYPVYLDGSLHWFTEGEENKILSFDLHRETFQVISTAPFSRERESPYQDVMGILDNCLCVSEKKGLTQVIWSFDSSGGNKTWKKLCSIDLTKTLSCFMEFSLPLAPIAILDNNKLWLQGHDCLEQPVIHDLHAKTYDLLPFKPKTRGYPVYYYQSLFSALSN